MADLNTEAERAAFEAWFAKNSPGTNTKRRADGAYEAENLNALWDRWLTDAGFPPRRAAPVVADDGLPPLPEPDADLLGDGTDMVWGAAKVRQAQRDAIAADRAARAQQKAQAGGCGWIGSVGDYAQFHVLLNTVCNASEELEKAEGREVFAAADNLEKAKDSLIAYIDGRTAGAAPDDVRDSTWRKLLEAVVREFPRHMGRRNNGNAPGHCHSRPGIWDDDNGALAGKPCAWCIAWNGAADALAAAPSPQQGKEGA